MGFASVYSAATKDPKSKKKQKIVAIKKLKHDTERNKSRNYAEAYFLFDCRGHPNILDFISCWDAGEELWLVTEFLQGGTLAEAANRHQFSEAHIAFVAREILKALDFLHSKKYAHRDLKSQNIMIDIHGQVKLIDFGLCCEFIDGPRYSMVGSPYWMAPEMIKRQPHSVEVDIWSFGACLLEFYLMAPPYSQVSGIKCMFMAATKGLQDQIPDTVEPPASRFLKRCLEQDPKKRATAPQLLMDDWIRGASRDGLHDIVRDIFLSSSLQELGFVFK